MQTTEAELKAQIAALVQKAANTVDFHPILTPVFHSNLTPLIAV
jgi:hypothetical protein